MFNIQGGEIIIILLLALVVLGPEKLPEAMRKMGQFYAEIRKMSTGFQNEFRQAVDEPMRELRDTANTLRDSADFTKLQTGERDEKPQSAPMGPIADTEAPMGDPAAAPADVVPSFEPVDRPAAEAPTAPPDVALPDAPRDEPVTSSDSKPPPFADDAAPEPAIRESTRVVEPRPAPFGGTSSAAPRAAPAADVAPSEPPTSGDDAARSAR